MTDSVSNQAPLEDLMAAMDVVDTLRHQSGIAARELDGEGRRERLLQRLNEMYRAQGIDVPEHILQEGIDALEEERFKYQPVAASWRTRIARIWVSRARWSKPIGFLAVVGSLFSGIYLVTDVLPERELRSGLPARIEASMSQIEDMAKNTEVVQQAQAQAAAARRALLDDDLPRAQLLQAGLAAINEQLQQSYSLRVVSRPDESSGVWRIPDINASGRNYYLIVEAIDKDNRVLELEILNEETNKSSRVKTWGIRVNEASFFKIAADKKDDGIIQSNMVGQKKIGYLQPEFSIPTTGGTITEW